MVVAFFVIHFILELSFLLFGFSAGMQNFDNPDNDALEIKSEIYIWIYTVLSFPLLFVMDRMTFLSSILPGFLGYIPFILNSALWSLVFYILIRKNLRKQLRNNYSR